MNLFRGYVPTKNKKCLIPFKKAKSEDLMTLQQVKELPEYAGILAEDVILIDIDDYDQSEKLMTIVEKQQLRCRVYETSRGKHFLFKNQTQKTCKTHTQLACGLIADIKVGCKNSYEVLKIDNKDRKIIYDIFEDEDYQDVPKWLLPVKSKVDFSNLEEGDGRNQALFNYILTLQSHNFSVEEARDCIRIINSNVLKNPLSDDELEVILRDEAFSKPTFFEDKAFKFDEFAIFLKNNARIIKINSQLHVYKDGIYVNGSTYIEAEMIKRIPNLNRARRSEVLSYLDILISENTPQSDANYIAFRNGIFDVVTKEFTDFSPDKILINKIDWNYNPDAYSEIADKTLDKISCHDKQIRSLLEEIIGYCFYRRNELRKAFILVGDKANGKSTYLDMVKTVLGDVNTSALDLNELDVQFKTAELFGKLANIGDDIADEFIPNLAMFKKLVSGDRLNAARKFEHPFDFNNYSKFLFSANNLPRIKDKTGAVIDRLIIVPFNAKFSKDDPDFDPYIKYKLRSEESMEYLIRIGLEGLERVLMNRGFTTSEKLQKELQDYAENNNPILLFFKETPEDVLVNNPTKDAFLKYQEFCLMNNFNPMSNIEFSKQVKKYYDFEIADKKINGRKYRIFVRKES